jgi:hypothetical protein
VCPSASICDICEMGERDNIGDERKGQQRRRNRKGRKTFLLYYKKKNKLHYAAYGGQ